MKIKIFKKKIETILLRRSCEENNYIIFFSNAKNDSFSLDSSTILKSALKHCFHNSFSRTLFNNFLKFSYFLNSVNFNLFISNLKSNLNPILFIKLKNLYIFNSSLNFANFFMLPFSNSVRFLLNLKNILFFWLFFLRIVAASY